MPGALPSGLSRRLWRSRLRVPSLVFGLLRLKHIRLGFVSIFFVFAASVGAVVAPGWAPAAGAGSSGSLEEAAEDTGGSVGPPGLGAGVILRR
jgi:hypothetical protein